MERTRKRIAAAAALCAALAAGCGSGGKGGDSSPRPGATPGPGNEPVAAADDELGSWVDEAALVVLTDHCAGTRSVQMDGPSGRLRLDDDEIPAAPGAASCRTEERFEAEGDGS